eukprot:CAMPEP_0173422944 /NCGR_PEP_ID=MMETSP1357-20121228/3452_1 /TAXON_ID=77926 /ORGANISM="Hemiselmis rufescens, Strain PCC563" /LENGTH=107 /DNA_ID=CAMNT_0014386013 /DNA_START=30 /DNA_END=350 /DNA_ORIENTATION=-
MARKMIDTTIPQSLDRPDYRGYNRSFRDRQIQAEHQKNLARSAARVEEMQARKKQNKYSETTPALIARKRTPLSQSKYKLLSDMDRGIAPQRGITRHQGGAEDLLFD